MVVLGDRVYQDVTVAVRVVPIRVAVSAFTKTPAIVAAGDDDIDFFPGALTDIAQP